MADPETYKVIIIGTADVGKTSLLVRFVYSEYHDRTKRNVCEERKVMDVGGKSLALELWDTAGQEKYRILGFSTGLTQRFYANASAVVIVYDITDEETYKEATEIWFKEAMHNLDHYGASNIPIILVGNKSDLQSREVEIDEARDFSRQFHLLPPIECSAKEDNNVTRVFQSVAQEIVKNGGSFLFCDSIILRDDVPHNKVKARTECCQ